MNKTKSYKFVCNSIEKSNSNLNDLPHQIHWVFIYEMIILLWQRYPHTTIQYLHDETIFIVFNAGQTKNRILKIPSKLLV